MVIGLDLMLLSNRTKWHVDRLSDNFVDGRKLYVKLKQKFYFLQSVAANLCCSYVMPPF